jgi:site-specific recombinase XerD
MSNSEEEISESVYIEWTSDFNILYCSMSPAKCELQIGHYNTAMDILSRVLHSMYGTTSFSKFYENREDPYISLEFSKHLDSVLRINNFKKSSKNTVIYGIKRILSHTSIPKSIIHKIALKSEVIKLEKNDLRNCLPKEYKKLPEDHPSVVKILDVALNIRKHSRVKTSSTIIQVIYYILNLTKKLGLNIDDSPDKWITDITSIFINSPELIKEHITIKKHINFIKTFFVCYLKLEMPDVLNKVYLDVGMFNIQEDTDIHRISAEELDLIYKASISDIRSEIIILLLCTTGMRIGGLANIKLDYITKIIGNKLVVNDIGKTIEKGNKWFSFSINIKLKELLWDFITNYRKSVPDCDYLFIGHSGQIATNRIRSIIKQTIDSAGLKGKHLHPHSFRHSFAHILFECGNNVECISKMLGHSSTATTENYYLKENAAEVSKRMNIPWLDADNKSEKIIPSFLTSVKVEKEKQVEKKKMKRDRNLQLKEFSKIMNTPQIAKLPDVPTFESV